MYVCVCVWGFPNYFSSEIMVICNIYHPLVGQGLLSIEASHSHSGGHAMLGRTPLDE